MLKRINLTSNAGTPPKADAELLEKIDVIKDIDFEEVAKVIREHKNRNVRCEREEK